MSQEDKPSLPKSRIPLDNLAGGPTLEGHPIIGKDGNAHNLNFFNSISLFNHLDAGEIAQVLRICTIENAAAGDVIFTEGDAAESLLILERGEVVVMRRSRDGHVPIAHLGDGSVVGEMALIVGGPRSATIKALAATRFYRLSGRNFDTLRRQRSVVAYKLLRNMLITLGDRHQNVVQRIGEVFARPEAHVEIFERHCRELAERINRVV